VRKIGIIPLSAQREGERERETKRERERERSPPDIMTAATAATS